MKTLTIVGGAVIGLSCALRAAESGWEVTVYEPDQTCAASRVAAGMLGIAGESRTGEDAYLAFAEQAMSRWPAFLERLGDDRIVAASSSLMVGVDSADVGELTMVADWLRGRGHPVEPLTGKEIRILEPAVSSRIRSGFRAGGELAVDNRRLLQVLSDRAAEAGVRTVRSQVTDLADVRGDQVVLAAGVNSALLSPDLGVYPSKGEVLRLGWATGALPPPEHVVRGRINGRAVYVVPRHDGVVVGATQYDGGDDRLPVAGGVADLLSDAIELMPSLREYRLLSAEAGLRPATPDGMPLIGRVDDRTVVATGHGRNGILMSAITAELVAETLAGKTIDNPSIDAGRLSWATQ
ncbi:glycine oxidase [Williamsia limnetica]|jgi:glycine oxidase|uniref:glycine oxidase n=1 Tax=Williamsia limnetica TaxID=882452 RepID=A0A318RP39_WILLI|nr:glycine oxidase ThiO [Williamsia limnetica]PYE16823.1 glycine oxidase [Williamsia limnetica]